MLKATALYWAHPVSFIFSVRLSILVPFIVTASLYVNHLRKKHSEYKLDLAVGKSHGCQLPPVLQKRWPLGIDRIKELWDANADGHLLAFLCSLAEHYEPVNSLYQHLLFGPRAFHVMHPRNIEAILSTNFSDYGFGARPSVFAPLLGKGVFTQEGPAWKHSRELLRKHFARAQYQDLQHFCEHVDNLVQRIGKGGVVDLQPLFFDLTLDVTTAVLFGHSVYNLRSNVDQEDKSREFADSFSVAQEGLAKRFRIVPFHSLYSPKSFRNACKTAHEYVDQYIDSIFKNNQDTVKGSSSWFIHELGGEAVSKSDLRDQLMNMLLAGRDTTACCLSWTFRLLVRHPRIIERLRAEIFTVMEGSTEPSRDQIRKMKFLTCIIKESLRLYPPVPLNNREAIRTTILPTGGGPDGQSPMLVRKGELVIFSPNVQSRRKNIYGPDADAFRPERWETGELSNISWAYFPFSGGPRQCLGEEFALLEVSYTVVRLLLAFPTCRLPEGEINERVGTERQRLTLVLSSADGCRVEISREEKGLEESESPAARLNKANFEINANSGYGILPQNLPVIFEETPVSLYRGQTEATKIPWIKGNI